MAVTNLQVKPGDVIWFAPWQRYGVPITHSERLFAVWQEVSAEVVVKEVVVFESNSGWAAQILGIWDATGCVTMEAAESAAERFIAARWSP